MNTIEINSQKEYDELKDFDGIIIIKNSIERIYVKTSSVVAMENSVVVAWENSSVEAWENSSGFAIDNAQIIQYSEGNKKRFKKMGNGSVKLWKQPKYDRSILKLAQKEGKMIVLYKSVDPETNCDFYTGTIKYELGKETEYPGFDSDEDRECGGGLHLSMNASTTQRFNKGMILKCLG